MSGGFSNDITRLLAKDTTVADLQAAIQQITVINQLVGTTNMVTIASGSTARIWGAWVSYAVSVGSAFSPAADFLYARVLDQQNGTLIAVNLAVQAASQAYSAHNSLWFAKPVSVSNIGDTIGLDVNGGTSISGITQRGSAGVYYSIP